MANSRSKKALIIIITSGFYRISFLLITFLNRTVFIQTMGEAYFGLNGLFSTIIGMLALTELGLSSAIMYHLYLPIAEYNTEKIKSLIHFYRWAYFIIGLVIILIGLSLMPLLPHIVNLNTELNVNLYIVYILNVLRVASSYLLFAYTQTLITAMQNAYIINLYNLVFLLISTICSCFVLWLTRNYYAYLIILLVITIINNFAIQQKALQLCPYLKDKDVKMLDIKEIKSIFKDVSSIVLFKITTTITNSIDNIVLSSMFGTVLVGYNTNYDALIAACTTIISLVVYGLNSGVGDMNVSSSTEKKLAVFREVDLINYYLVTTAFCVLLNLSNDFIWLWLHDRRYILPIQIVFLKAFCMLFVGILSTCFMFREAMGLFSYGKYRNLVSGFANLVLTIILAKLIGVEGVFLATAIAAMCISVFVFPKIVFKYGFKLPYRREQFYLAGKITLTVLIGLGEYFLFSLFQPVTNISGFILKAMIAVIIPVIFLSLLYCKTMAMKNLLTRVSGLVKKI